MILDYGSVMYFVYMFVSFGICPLLYFVLRKRSMKAKKIAVLVVLFLNLTQHLFKGIIYPMYWGNYSIHFSSAYNVCAFLIIVSPFVFLFGNETLKNYVTFLGAAAAVVAIVVPYWDVGQNAFSWEIYRFYICHSLLFTGALLPPLFGFYKINYRHFWKYGLIFFISLAIIIANDAFFVAIGHYPVKNPDNMYYALAEINPCWSIRPPEGFGFLNEVFEFFTPAFFSGDNKFGVPLPFLWYFIPMYIFITIMAFLISILIDKKHFVNDLNLIKK